MTNCLVDKGILIAGYALGRMSYAVSDIADALVFNHINMSSEAKTLITSQIEKAIENGGAGSEFDSEK